MYPTRLSNKAVALMLACCLLLGLAACGAQGQAPAASGSDAQTAPGTEAPSDGESDGETSGTAPVPAIDRGTLDESLYAKGQAVPKADDKTYYVLNPIKIDTVEVGGSGFNGSYVRISGLKDKAVQKSINQTIKDTFDELSDPDYIPPYVGSAMVMRKVDPDEMSTWVYTECYGSVGNILSVTIRGSKDVYDEETEHYYWYEDVRTFNVDLATGLQVRLTDLFSDDQDVYAILDDAVREGIRAANTDDATWAWGSDSLIMTSPFTGVKADQKYSYNADYNNVTLVFDYETPEFYCTTNAQYVTVSLDGRSAVNSRFAAKDLYEDDSGQTGYRLVVNSFDEMDYQNDYEDLDLYSSTRVSTTKSSSWYDGMPAGQIEYAKFPYSEMQPQVDAFRRIWEATCDDYGEDNLYGSLSFSSYCSRYGDYTNVDRYCGSTIWTTTDWQYLYDAGYDRGFVFKGESSTPLALKDLFRPGTDWKSLLIDAFAAGAEEVYPDVDVDKDVLRAAGIEDLLDKATFTLISDAICFDYEDVYLPTLHDVAENQWVVPDDAFYNTSYLCRAAFDDIGAQNLTLFE